jgi:hypothetical protein
MRAKVCRAALTKPATAGVLHTAHWLYAVPLPHWREYLALSWERKESASGILCP